MTAPASQQQHNRRGGNLSKPNLMAKKTVHTNILAWTVFFAIFRLFRAALPLDPLFRATLPEIVAARSPDPEDRRRRGPVFVDDLVGGGCSPEDSPGLSPKPPPILASLEVIFFSRRRRDGER